jgi:Ca2+/H+ antiporter, TMEM165/GDT1 family
MRRLSRPLRFLLFLPLAICGILLFGWIVMLLWNGVLSPVLHVSNVTIWQALGILLLSKILFSSFSGGGRRGRSKQKENLMWQKLTPEQKEEFKQEWKERCRRSHYGSWRNEEMQSPD